MSRSLRFAVGTAIVSVPLSIGQVGVAAAQDLPSFAIVSGQSLTNTGPTTILGNIAISPGISFTGAGSVTQTGSVYVADAVAERMQADLATLYPYLAGRQPTLDLTGQDLGGLVLGPGVYNFDSSAGLAGRLILDAGGDQDAVFIFNIGSTLVLESGSVVELRGEAQGGNVFYRVGSSATLHTTAVLEGQIVAMASVTLNTGASIPCGAAYARSGSVTLDTNVIQICTLAGRGFDEFVDDPLLSETQQAVRRALSEYVSSGGVLPLGFSIVAATQTPDELASSLAQLSGQVSTGIAPMGMQSMNAFLDSVIASGRTPRSRTMVPGVAPRDEGIPIGLVREDRVYTGKHGSEKYGSEPDQGERQLAFPATMVEQAQPWDVWVSGYGSHTVTDGDATLGWQERTSRNRGLAAGLNFSPSANADLGIAVSWNKADFTLANGFGSGSGDTIFVALRGRTEDERSYLEGALAYGRSDISTDRTVTIADVDRLIGETKADNFAAHLEAGYYMGNFTPFVGMRAQSLTTKAYSETAASGASTYTLQYDRVTARSLRSELGVDMQWDMEQVGGGATVFGLRAAWAHEFASNDPTTKTFVTLPGLSFQEPAAPRDRDSLILAVNATRMASSGLYVGGEINAEYSSNTRNFGGSLKMGYRW